MSLFYKTNDETTRSSANITWPSSGTHVYDSHAKTSSTMKYKLTATIPVVDYGNIIPELEVEGDDPAEMHARAMEHITRVWQAHASRPLPDRSGGGRVVKTFTGEEIIYNDDTHTYLDKEGNELLSGSKYAESLTPQFNRAVMVPKVAKDWGVPEEAIEQIWSMNSDVSTNYGNSIHTALELYHLHKAEGEAIAKKKELDFNYVLPKNDHIRQIVLDFEEQFGLEGLTEVMVSDVANKRAGQIDKLVVLDEDKKVCRIGDYKTNNDLDAKKLKKYQHQLSFYAHILKAFGWTVEGLDLYHYSNGWEHHKLDVLDLKTG